MKITGGVADLKSRVSTLEARLPVINITKTITIGTDWTDTGICRADLVTGAYIVYFNGIHLPNRNWQIWEQYVGLMSWFDGHTNSSESCEIPLHYCGHAHNDDIVHLRTLSHYDHGGDMCLQIKENFGTTAAIPVTFHFLKVF